LTKYINIGIILTVSTNDEVIGVIQYVTNNICSIYAFIYIVLSVFHF